MSLRKDKLNFNILKVKGYNFTLILLISIQLILILTTTIMFIYSMVETELKITSVFGFVGLMLICIPICGYIYIKDPDSTVKNIFLCIAIMLLLNALSGIIWYIVPIAIQSDLLVPIAMTCMVLGYVPLLIILFKTFINERSQLISLIKIIIFYINGAFILTMLYLIAMNRSENIVSNFSMIIYTSAIIGDILILSFSTALFLINISTQKRYIYSILFVFYSLSFIGDTLMLLNTMKLYNLPEISQNAYDIMFIFLTGALILYLLSNIKMTTVEEVNKKLKDTTLVVEDLITQSPEPTCMCDASGKIIKANNIFLKILNLPVEEINNINIFSYNFQTDIDITPIIQGVKNGNTVIIDSVKITDNGAQRYLSLKLYPTYSSDGIITNYVLIGEDITDRKNAYELLESKVRERTSELSILNAALQNEIREHKIDEEKIKTSLKEKEVLLKEIHHRVKNNMQVISSMLELQLSYAHNEQLDDIIKDCQSRIKSMALIHEKLYQSDNLAYINFSEYTHTLVKNLNQSHKRHENNVQVIIDIDNISFNIDMAIPIGLLLNELISNSFKHAFPDNRSGEIYVGIKETAKYNYVICVRDNGIGFSEDFEMDNLKTLGLNLVNILVEQIDAKLTLKKENGTAFIIEFQNKN